MTILWLFVWLIQGTPALHTWNAWLVSLLVCAFVDLCGIVRRNSASTKIPKETRE